jgi:hypothetical protein
MYPEVSTAKQSLVVGHDMALVVSPAIAPLRVFQVAPPSSVDTMSPMSNTDTPPIQQSESDAQETAYRSPMPGSVVVFQDDPPSVVTIAVSLSPTAMQFEVDGHDTARRLTFTVDVSADQVTPPFAVAIIMPASPTAQQAALDEHETP